MKTRSIAYVAVMTALLCVLAPLAVPTGWVPFSLGTLAVYIVSGLVDWKHGIASIGAYLLLGVCCLPVFNSFTTLYQCIGGNTFGYVIGYIPCVLICGIMTDKVRKYRYFFYPLAMVIGTFFLYLTGTVWFCFVTNMNFVTALMYCVVPYLAFDAAKIAAATVIVCALKPKLTKYRQKITP